MLQYTIDRVINVNHDVMVMKHAHLSASSHCCLSSQSSLPACVLSCCRHLIYSSIHSPPSVPISNLSLPQSLSHHHHHLGANASAAPSTVIPEKNPAELISLPLPNCLFH
mmetsp:Transcript_14831/g.22225  ORF Transcript_14831/g.22225 Transcript_14831/m.22225 type:complete len:110 (+) Transcript_14831:1092-1421(+)